MKRINGEVTAHRLVKLIGKACKVSDRFFVACLESDVVIADCIKEAVCSCACKLLGNILIFAEKSVFRYIAGVNNCVNRAVDIVCNVLASGVKIPCSFNKIV